MPPIAPLNTNAPSETMNESALNEQAVREEIIAPILKALNYQANTENNIRYELSLRYPKESLGRKSPSKDPVLRGKADYVCYAGGLVSWTIEAKPSSIPLSMDDVEQAFSYARHPEVRAVYFCLCNGKEFRIYITEAGPSVAPIVAIDPRELGTAVLTLREFVGPPALLGRFARRASAALPSIGRGLDSFAQITQGHVTHETTTPDFPHMRGFTVFVTGGAIQRSEGSLLAYWESRAPHSAIQKLLERLGLLRIEARASGDWLSSDRNVPTVFRCEMKAVFPKGEQVPDVITGKVVALPHDMNFEIGFQGRATLAGTVLQGPFDLQVRIKQRGFDGGFSSRGFFEFVVR